MQQARRYMQLEVNPHEACRVYRLIRQITDDGCEAEVKMVKGQLKILKVRKQLASE